MITIEEVLGCIPEVRRKEVFSYRCPTLSKKLRMTAPNYIPFFLEAMGVEKEDVIRHLFDYWHKAILYTSGDQDVQGVMLCVELQVFSRYDARLNMSGMLGKKDSWSCTRTKSLGCKKDIDVRNALLEPYFGRHSPTDVRKIIDKHTAVAKRKLIDVGIESGLASVYCPGRKVLSRTVENLLLVNLLTEKTKSTKIMMTK
jgi:hypothetical protein